MKYRLLALIGALATLIAVSLVPVLVKAQTRRAPEQEASSRRAKPFDPAALNWKPTFTPWGDPDIQGEWTGMSPTPLERPRPDQNRITDPVELARLFDADPDSETGAQRGVSTYNAGWREYGRLISDHPAFKAIAQQPRVVTVFALNFVFPVDHWSCSAKKVVLGLVHQNRVFPLAAKHLFRKLEHWPLLQLKR